MYSLGLGVLYDAVSLFALTIKWEVFYFVAAGLSRICANMCMCLLLRGSECDR